MIVVRSPHLEAILLHVLSIQQHGLNGSTVGFMVHINLEAFFIVSCNIMTDKHMLDGLAQECEGSAEQTGC